MESVVRVSPRDDFMLELWFDNGAHRLFDARPYLERGVFARSRIRQSSGKPMSLSIRSVGPATSISPRKRSTTVPLAS